MAIPSMELQKALYSTLSSGQYSVFDLIPTNAPKNYIVIGEEILTKANTKTQDRSVHNVVIHAWSKGSSSYDIKVLNNFIIDILLNQKLNMSGFHVDLVSLEMLTTLEEVDEDLSETFHHGIHNFEITLTRMEEI